MNAKACREDLSALLANHVAQIDVATAYLRSVKQAIADNNVENLQQALEHPDFDVDAIERLEVERHRLLETHGFSANFAGFEKCIAWCDDADGGLAKLYQQLVQSLIALQHSIQLNQLLVNRGRDRVRRSLSLLSGLGGAGQARTYGSDGKPEPTAGRRDIATA